MVLAAVLTYLFLASAALAAPPFEAMLQRRTPDHHSKPTRYLEAPVDNAHDARSRMAASWAGAVHRDAAGSWSVVSARFTVPDLTDTDSRSVSVWVGIDGITCQTSSFAAGVIVDIDGGMVQATGWYYFSAELHGVYDVAFSPGDVVIVTVNATSPTSGIASFDNLSNNNSTHLPITSDHPLCQQDASWAVKLVSNYDPCTNLANFGTIVMSDAYARTGYGTEVHPDTATVIDIMGRTTFLTSSSADNSSVTVAYNGCS